MVDVTFGGQCCLCGREIEATETDPCEVTVTTANGKWQMWWCHGDCFSYYGPERRARLLCVRPFLTSAFHPSRALRSGMDLFASNETNPNPLSI